jgi:hypothetical protein
VFNLAAGFAGAFVALVASYEVPDSYSPAAEATDVFSDAAARGFFGLAALMVLPLLAGGVSGVAQWAFYSRRLGALALWLAVAVPAAVVAAVVATVFYAVAGAQLDVTFARLAAVALFVAFGTYATWFVLVFLPRHAQEAD